MNDRLLLISPAFNKPVKREMYPNGALALLKAIAINEGKEVRTIQMVSDKFSISDIQLFVADYKPDMVGLTFNTFQTRSAKEVSHAIKAIRNVPIIAGGPHISSAKVGVMQDFPNIDWFISGEGENIFKDIINRRPALRCFIENETTIDLDTLPIPDYSDIILSSFGGAPPPSARPSMFMMASRGCPYQCIFCNKSIYGSCVRYKNPETVIKEIKSLRDLGTKEIFFQDDTFNVNEEWLFEILGRMKKEEFNGLVFRAPVRANLVNPVQLKKLKDSGFWLLFYGVENGNAEILKSIKKGLTIEQIVDAFKITDEAGIKTEASFIIGLPGETNETIEESIGLYKKIKPYWAGFSAAIPFPCTQFTKIASEAGNIINYDYDTYWYDTPIVKTQELAAEDIVNISQRINKSIRRDKLLNTFSSKRTALWFLQYLKDILR
jgi:radical SAM superfamily enzyme YgiQ (UPF0313 family)